MARLGDARLYYVSDEIATLPHALEGGIDLFQLRMKEAADDDVLRVAADALALCREAGVPFVLNDRPDLAVRAGADGVHVGQDDMPVAEARAIVGPDAIVGRSTHRPEDLAASTDADYVAVGPVHATPTKPGRPAAGIEYVRHAARAARGPWFAIGGIDLDTIGAVVEAGARRVVVVRAIRDAADPGGAAAALKRALTEAPVGQA